MALPDTIATASRTNGRSVIRQVIPSSRDAPRPPRSRSSEGNACRCRMSRSSASLATTDCDPGAYWFVMVLTGDTDGVHRLTDGRGEIVGHEQRDRVDTGHMEPRRGMRSGRSQLRQLLRTSSGEATQGHGRGEVPERWGPQDLRTGFRGHDSSACAGAASAMARTQGCVRQLDERPVPRQGAARLHPRHLQTLSARRRTTLTRCSRSAPTGGQDRRKLEWPENLWMGVSVESSEVTDRIDHLRTVPAAATRFLSCEPLFTALPGLELDGIDWVIAGGESGPRARPMDAAWVEDIRDRASKPTWPSSSSSGAAEPRRPTVGSWTAAPGTTYRNWPHRWATRA